MLELPMAKTYSTPELRNKNLESLVLEHVLDYLKIIHYLRLKMENSP